MAAAIVDAGDPVRGLFAAFSRQDSVLPRHRPLELSRARVPARGALAWRAPRLESLPGAWFSGVRRSALRHFLSAQLALSSRRAGLGGQHAQLAVLRARGVGRGRRVLAGAPLGWLVESDHHRRAFLGALGLHHGPVDVGPAALRRCVDPLGRRRTRRLARQSARGRDGLASRPGQGRPAQRLRRAARRNLPGHDRRRVWRPLRDRSASGRVACEAGRLGRPRSIAGRLGNPSRVSISTSWRSIATECAPPLARHRCRRCRACIRGGALVIPPARMPQGRTERAAPPSRAGAESCSLPPLRLVELALPQSMGDAYGVYPAATVVGEPRLDGLPLSYSVYMGASVLAVALAALGRGRRLALLLGGLATVALLLAFGKHTPAHAIFRRVVFPLSYMRYPEKYMVLVVAMFALLASLGARRILSDERQPWRRTGVLLLLIVAFAFVSALTFPPAWVVFAVHGALLGGLATLGMLAVHVLAGRASPLAPPF